MGKLIMFVSMIIFMDLIFLITGQVTGTFNSSIINAMLDLGNVKTSTLFIELLGDLLNSATSLSGILSIIAGTGLVYAGLKFGTSDTPFFVPMAISFALMGQDFINIFLLLSASNFILALLIMAPIVAIYIIVVVDWLRGKD